MPLRLDETGFSANSRLGAIVHASHVLRCAESWRGLLPGHDYEQVMILLAVIAISGERLLRTELPEQARRLDVVLDPSLPGPVNISSIGHATGLNRETARRKVNALVEEDFLVRSAEGAVTYRRGLLQEERILALLREHLAAIATTANQLERVGILVES